MRDGSLIPGQKINTIPGENVHKKKKGVLKKLLKWPKHNFTIF